MTKNTRGTIGLDGKNYRAQALTPEQRKALQEWVCHFGHKQGLSVRKVIEALCETQDPSFVPPSVGTIHAWLKSCPCSGGSNEAPEHLSGSGRTTVQVGRWRGRIQRAVLKVLCSEPAPDFGWDARAVARHVHPDDGWGLYDDQLRTVTRALDRLADEGLVIRVDMRADHLLRRSCRYRLKEPLQ